MHKHKYIGAILAGLGAGTVTGLFGAGGGMVLIPLLMACTELKDEAVFSSSISIILPICLISLATTARTGIIQWHTALPYLLGSGVGGFFAGKWGRKIPVSWLHRGLAILILWGGYRYLC